MKTVVLLILSVILIKCEISNFKLKYVHVFFRHGSRTPDLHELYPKDPYIDVLTKAGLGQLTEEGKQNSCKLGHILRNRYKNFLEDKYSADVISTQTTESERANLTAQLVLNGMFLESCTIQPGISYNITRKPYELSLVNLYCPNYMKELRRILNTTKTKSILRKTENLFRYISLNAEQNYTSFREVFFLYETLASEKACNLTLPLWADKVYEEIKNIAITQLKYESGSKLLKRLNGGRMLRKVVDTIQKKIDDVPEYKNKKMTLYSGHDFNIANILSSLNVYKPHLPNFNSAVALELYQNCTSNKHYVKIVYFKNINLKAKELKMPKCSTMCNFLKFKRNMLPYLPFNYTKECDSQILLD